MLIHFFNNSKKVQVHIPCWQKEKEKKKHFIINVHFVLDTVALNINFTNCILKRLYFLLTSILIGCTL